jgi:hypothetical protein
MPNELPETLPYDNNGLKTCRILNIRKARYVPAIAVTQQPIKKEAV